MSVPAADLRALVNDPDLFTADFEGKRDQLLLLLLYGLGLRRAEVISLTPAHFDWSRKLVRVIGKRNKERQIPMPSLLEEYYLRYIEIRDQLPTCHDPALLLTAKGKSFTTILFIIGFYITLIGPQQWWIRTLMLYVILMPRIC